MLVQAMLAAHRSICCIVWMLILEHEFEKHARQHGISASAAEGSQFANQTCVVHGWLDKNTASLILPQLDSIDTFATRLFAHLR